MRVKSVKIKNFRGFGENIDDEDGLYCFNNLDSNLTLISGHNGYGKTSFFEAIEWALTDGVTRIKSLNDVYHANTLQNKHTLKFISPNRHCTKEREVLVTVMFNDGLEICRKSNNDFIKITENSEYNSTVSYRYNNKSISKKGFLELNYPDFEQDNFLKNHFLMQDNVNAFFKMTKPEDRRELIMELLDINDLNELYKTTNDLIRLKKFSNKRNEIEKNRIDIKNNIEELENRIKETGFNSIQNYIEQFVSIIVKMENIKLEETNPLSDLLKETLTEALSKKVNMRKAYNFAEDLKRKVNEEKIKINEALVLDKTLAELLVEYKEYSELNVLLRKETDLKRLKEINVNKSKLTKKIKKHQEERIHRIKEYEEKEWRIKKALIPKINLSTMEYSEKMDQISSIKEKIKDFNEKYPGDKMPVNNLELVNVRAKQEEYKLILKKLKNVNEKKKSIDERYSKHSKLTKEHEDLLNNAMVYIQKNEVEECPVCLNTKFEYLENVADTKEIDKTLLSIISNIKSSGEKSIELLVIEKKEINNDIIYLDNEKSELDKECEEIIRSVTETVNNLIKKNKKEYKNKYYRLDQMYIKVQNELEEITNEIIRYNKIKTKLKIQNEGDLDENIELNKVYINKIIKKSNIYADLKVSDVISILKERKNMFRERYKVDVNTLEITNFVKELKMKEKNYNEVFKKLEKITLNLKELENYSLSDRQFQTIENYDSSHNKLKKLNEQSKLIDKYEVKIKKYRKEVNEQRMNYINNFVDQQPIIEWIYSMISPHKFYKDIELLIKDKSFNVTDLENKVYLDHIFSSAQLNTLSLSIFLGMGLTFRKNKLNNLFIDDPIQSLDDVNILSLIDIFRALPKSDYKGINLVISSHDDKFTQLLSIKMRNHHITHYKFIDYTEEGPVVELLS